MSESVWSRLKILDAYAKPLDDFRVRTVFGGTLTFASAIIMTLLFSSELMYYLQVDVKSELVVDMSRNQRVDIFFDIKFNHISCSYLTVDVMDVAGASVTDIMHNVFKERLDENGSLIEVATKEVINKGSTEKGGPSPVGVTLDPNRCESCYGAESASHRCCNTCGDVREAYRRKGWAATEIGKFEQCRREGAPEKEAQELKEGCRLYGHVSVNKVAGNFHIAPGSTFKHSHSHVHDLQAFSGRRFNASHTIRYLAFGGMYPGMKNPLENHIQVDNDYGRMFQYFIQIVPTRYEHLYADPGDNKTTESSQYSVTWHSKKTGGLFADGLPGVFFQYEFSPMMVKFTETRRSFTHFLTSVCAITGGVYTVASIIDMLFYQGSRLIREKIDLGKQG